TFPFDNYQANQFKDTLLRFWKYVEEEAPELSSTNQMIEETNSSDKEIEPEPILDKLDCTRVVNEWFMKLDNEVYKAKDYDLDNTEILHPAEDPQAKWNLNTLFSSTLLNLS
ncbi:18450_t:CDS:2, partial [Dentiscutata erythropus]